MSSILNALKKLEDETGPSDTHGISQAVDTKAVVRKGIQEPRSYGKILWGCLALTVLGLGAWYMISRNPSFSGKPVTETASLSAENIARPAPEKSVSGNPAASEKKTDLLSENNSGADDKKEAGSQGGIVSRRNTPGISPDQSGEGVRKFREIIMNQGAADPENEKMADPFRKPDFIAGLRENSPEKGQESNPQDIRVLIPENTGADSANEKKRIPKLPAPADPVKPEPSLFPKPAIPSADRFSAQPAGKPDDSETEKSPVPEVPEKKSVVSIPTSPDNYKSVPEKTSGETGLEIQALVWSEDADGRMAVINGSIVRQAGMVADVTVSLIGSDFIVFRNKSEQWKQKFRLN